MLCFLCCFAKGGYCYCRPGRPVTVLSTLNMLIVDTSIPTAEPFRRRARSEPTRRKECSQFVRFRSLRETKVERRDRKKPLRVDVVSIASSSESKLRRRKTRRERAQRRLEAQLSTSSTSLQSMASDALQPLMADRSMSSSSSDASGEVSSSAQLAQATEIPSHTSFAVLVNGTTHFGPGELPSSDSEDVSKAPKKICPAIIDRLHLDLVQLPDSVPNGWYGSVSYVTDMEQFVQKIPANAFVDPFEEEERRSRTEMWVESTSPGYPSEEENKNRAAGLEESEDSMEVPEVKASECSEKSVSASPPGNTTTSTTGVDEEPLPPSVQIHINGELLPTAKIQKNVNRMDSLATTSEVSENNSLVSSEVDKISLVKCTFTNNIQQAREDAQKEVDFDEIDRFWRYRYNKPQNSQDEEKEKAKTTKEARSLSRRRGRTPTIERVVLYYTTDHRLSLTPSLSSLSPSPEPFSQRSPIPNSGQNLFIQSPKPPLLEQSSLSSEPTGDIYPPPVRSLSTEQNVLEEREEEEVMVLPTVFEENSKKSKRKGVFFEEDELEQDSAPTVSFNLCNLEDIEVQMEKPAFPTFFRLDRTSSSDDSEEGKVFIENTKHLSSPIRKQHSQLMDQSTSTADLVDFQTDVITRDGRSDANANYKREVHDRATVTSPSLDDTRRTLEKQMQDQTTSTSVSPAPSPQPPLLVLEDAPLEDAPETDVSLSGFDRTEPYKFRQIASSYKIVNDTISDKNAELDAKSSPTSVSSEICSFSDLESSSVEDLLAIETRPNSSNRKSVTFSDQIDVEAHSPEPMKKAPSPSPQNPSLTVKPILKKEDKQRETMRRLLEYAAERLYRDLLMLIEERDRSVHALEITPNDEEDLPERTSIFQRNYREKLLDNKLALDKRIDQVWTKLKDMPIDGHKAHLVYGVRHSSELTLNIKRRLGGLRRSSCQLDPRPRNGMEMASDFSRRLSCVRAQMIRRDSDSLIAGDDHHSMGDLLSAVSRIFGSYEKLSSN